MQIKQSRRLLPALLLAWSAALWPVLSLAADAGTDQKPAEPYVAVYGGITFPNELREAELLSTPFIPRTTFSDIDLERSLIAGIKLGAYQSPALSWFGAEMELFYSSPHVKEQLVQTNITGVGSLQGAFPGARIRVAAWALNLLLRYPGDRIQPYIGAGLGIFWGRLSGPEAFWGTGSDTSPGLNALAGMRFSILDNLVLFGEYKYNRVTFDFGGTAALSVLYQAHHVVGGLALQF